MNNPTPVSVLFFGSAHDSVLVLERLISYSNSAHTTSIDAVVTQPPKPVGRKKILTPTPVENYATQHGITVLSFAHHAEKPWLYADEQAVVDTLESVGADLIVSASYGQKIPTKTLTDTRFGGLNIHPSILPRWRGGDPVPWAILSGDHQIGVTVVSLSERFDEGKIYAQKKIPITGTDTSGPLRTKLFIMGADLLVSLLPDYLAGKADGKPQKTDHEPYAKRLSRELGYEPWETIRQACGGNADETRRIERKFRALTPWPGLWTTVRIRNEQKRLKFLSLRPGSDTLLPDSVQLEGKNPVDWKQFLSAYGTATSPAGIQRDITS